MSASPEIDRRALDEERRRLNQRLEEVSRLSEGDSPPGVFYGEMLRRLLESLAAPAGAVWMKTVQGNLQLQFQINLKDTGLDQSEASRVSHDELLRSALAQGKPFHMMPRTSLGGAQEGQSAGGNPTDFIQMLVPVQVSGQVAGLIEVWQGGNRALNAIPGFLQYMGMMADLCARYARNQMMAQLSGQQQVWTQLETFSRQVHGSLNVTEVSYLISNEGRRLVQCDRVCMIASRHGAIEVTAISGADVVEKRSNLVQTLRGLCKEVMKWGERLEFQGVRDDTLPPKVLQHWITILQKAAASCSWFNLFVRKRLMPKSCVSARRQAKSLRKPAPLWFWNALILLSSPSKSLAVWMSLPGTLPVPSPMLWIMTGFQCSGCGCL